MLPPRSRDTTDKSFADWIGNDHEDDWDYLRLALQRSCNRRRVGNN